MSLKRWLKMGLLNRESSGEPAPTHYVATTGNDTTGDGSLSAPWATITKALATVPIGGGSVIAVADGTYQESTSGLGYLYLNRAFASQVIVRSLSADASKVIIQGASSTSFDTRLGAPANLTFRKVSFIPRLTTNTSAVKCSDGSPVGIAFIGCVFGIEANAGVAVSIVAAAGKAISGLSFIGCQVVQTGANQVGGFRITTTTTGTVAGVLISGCTINTTASAIYIDRQITGLTIQNTTCANTAASVHCVRLDAITNLTITNLTASAAGAASIPLIIGADAETGNASSNVVISGGTYTATLSHGMLIGAVVDGGTVTGVMVDGGDQGLALKCCKNIAVSNSVLSTKNGGHAAYFKGASDCTIEDCTISAPAGYVLGMGATGATKAANNTYQRNACTASAAAAMFEWLAAEDGGGNVNDYNVYTVTAPATWGAVLGSAVTDLASLQAAWAAYGDGSNDSHSTAAP